MSMPNPRDRPAIRLVRQASSREQLLADPDAEAKMVGGVLKYPDDGDNWEALTAHIRSADKVEMLYVDALRTILQSIFRVHATLGMIGDVEVIAADLEQHGQLDAITYGGMTGRVLLHSLEFHGAPSHLHIYSHAKTIADLWHRREIVRVTREAFTAAHDRTVPSEEVHRVADGALADIWRETDPERKEGGTDHDPDRPHRAYGLLEVASMPKPVPILGEILHSMSVETGIGRSGSWKSTIAASMIAAMAGGYPWLDRYPVTQGAVLWIAGESASFTVDQIIYELRQHQVDPAAAPIRVIIAPPNLSDPEAVARYVTEECQIMEEDFGQPVQEIVWDTVSACATGNVKEAQEVNAIYRGLRAVMRQTGASSLLIHHPGWGEALRESGSYSLRGSSDSTFTVDSGSVDPADLKPGMPVSLQPLKPARGCAGFEPISITTEIHTLFADDGSVQRTLLIPVSTELVPPPRAASATQAKADTTLSDLLTIARNGPREGMSNADLKHAFMAKTGLSAPTFDRKLGLLAKAGNLTNVAGLWRPSDDA